MTIQHVPSSHWRRTRSVAAPATAPKFQGVWLGDEVEEAYPPHPGCRMTEEEFLEWAGERTRAEWVNGDIIIMSPVNYFHDHLQSWLLRLVADFVEEHDLGDVCSSEFNLRIPSAPSLRLTDLFFVAKGRESLFARLAKVKEGPATCFNGAPELIVEVVSPDSVDRDAKQKFQEYQKAGVREYWLINPLEKTAAFYELTRGKFRLIPEKDGALHSKVLKGFLLKPDWLWQSPLPKKRAILRQMGIE